MSELDAPPPPFEAVAGLSESELRELVGRVPQWHHTIHFRSERAENVVTPGAYDPRGMFELLQLGDLSGKRVLDVGTRDGFFAFACERLGAEVVAVDHADPAETGFPEAKRILGSKVEYLQKNVYEITPGELGLFDVVLFLGVFYHLRHPLLALDRLREVCRGTIVVESLVCDQSVFTGAAPGAHVPLASLSKELVELPVAQFLERGRFHADETNKWSPNVACLQALLREAAFEVLDVHTWGDRALLRAEISEDRATLANVEFDRGLRARRSDETSSIAGTIRTADFVAFLYEALFERSADESSVAHWCHQVEQRGLQAVFLDFLATPEAHSRIGRNHYFTPYFTNVPIAFAFPLDEETSRELTPLRIVDVGALVLDSEEDVYRPLLSTGLCEVIGFEPLDEEREKRRVQDPGFVLLPQVVGDGGTRTFHRTAARTTSSLYPPNRALLEQFVGLSEHLEVVEETPVETVRLDDVAETEGAIYLKIDVQGAELDVLRGAPQRLAELTILHLEVEFGQLYTNQPLFTDVHAFAVAHGFELFDFANLERYFYKSKRSAFDFAPRRLLWGDAVFIKPLREVAALDRRSLLQTCLVMHSIYQCYDFCSALLEAHDERFGGDLAIRYLANASAAAGGRIATT